MKIAIGADHRGFNHKEYIKQHIASVGWLDVGAFDKKRSDYPIFSHAVCNAMLVGDAMSGVLICGTGVGMAITANRYKSIYAALVWNEEIAIKSKKHDNTNILVLPADYVSLEQSVKMINAWRAVSFIGGRYAQRVNMIDQ